MTTEQQIEQQLQNEFDKFYNEPHKGDVPENIVVLFKKAAMELAPQSHQILATKIKAIAAKTPKELTNGELHDVIRIIVNIPLRVFYNDFEEAFESHKKIEKFILSYNESINNFQENLKMKKVNLLNLSGLRNNSKGLKIVN